MALLRNPGAPGAVFEVPTHGVAQAHLERAARAPADLALDLRGVDGVAAVVPRAILDEGHQVAVGARRPGRLGVERMTHGRDDVEVAALAATPDEVRLARAPALEDGVE